jgi:hypothetical protein
MSNSFSQVLLGDIDHVHRAHGADGTQQVVTTFANGGELRLTVAQAAEYVSILTTLIGPELDRLFAAVLSADCSGSYYPTGDTE